MDLVQLKFLVLSKEIFPLLNLVGTNLPQLTIHKLGFSSILEPSCGFVILFWSMVNVRVSM